MIYDKEKISKLYRFKENVNNKWLKEDLQWLLSSYNKLYIKNKELVKNYEETRNLVKNYYDLEDKCFKLIKENQNLKCRYSVLLQDYENLLKENKSVAKSKNM